MHKQQTTSDNLLKLIINQFN